MRYAPPFLWHNKLHERWADERLVFFFFGFEPTYSREEGVEDLQRFLSDHDVISYQMYEVTAPYDILVRAWVPARTRLTELKEKLELSSGERQVALVLEVREIIHHWAFAKSARARIGEMRLPVKAELEAGRPTREREELNRLQREVAAEDLSTLPRDTRRLIKKYRDRHLLVRPKYRGGIRFFILVKVQHRNNYRELQRLLKRFLNDASRVIHNPSLYRLDDHHQFLIFGQVTERGGDFHAISKRLVSPINDVVTSARARTYTSFFPTPGFLAFCDDLRTPEMPEPSEPAIEELLAQPEGQRLEFKGSAWTDLDQWLRSGAPRQVSDRPAKDARNKAVNALMRAIASLLNSDGGHIVIGALEKSKYGGSPTFDQLPTFDERGALRCLGIEDDYRGRDWDEFARELRDVIEHRFDPVPSTRWLRVRPAKAAGRPMCVIDVEVPDEFFYVRVADKNTERLEEEFIVRVEGKTKKLKGAETRRYEKSTRRAPRTLDE